MKGYNVQTERRTVHIWKPSPTPLNPRLMRSVCGRAYAQKQSIAESEREPCSACAKHPNGDGK